MANKVKRFYNLTQYTKGNLCYFRSTDIEQNNWQRLLWSIPDAMLYYLSRGEQVTIYDISSNKGKVEHILVPVLNDLLNNLAFSTKPKNLRLKPSYAIARDHLVKNKLLYTRMKFWTSRFIAPILISGHTTHVKKEPMPELLRPIDI